MDKADKSTDRHFSMRPRSSCCIMSPQTPTWLRKPFVFIIAAVHSQFERILTLMDKVRCYLLGRSMCAKPPTSQSGSQPNYRMGCFLARWPMRISYSWASFPSKLHENKFQLLELLRGLSLLIDVMSRIACKQTKTKQNKRPIKQQTGQEIYARFKCSEYFR